MKVLIQVEVERELYELRPLEAIVTAKGLALQQLETRLKADDVEYTLLEIQRWAVTGQPDKDGAGNYFVTFTCWVNF